MNAFGLTKNRGLALLILLLVFSLLLAACGGGEEAGDEAAVEDAIEEAVADLVSDGSDSVSGAGLCANQYLPVVEGASWTYGGTESIGGEYMFTSTLMNVHENGFTYHNDFDELLQEQEWGCFAEGLRALDFDRGAAASVSVAGTEARFESSDVEGLTLPSEISVGDTWEQSFSITSEQDMGEGIVATTVGNISMISEAIGEELVSVPAGDFMAMKIRTDITFDLTMIVGESSIPNLFESESIVWYAPGVGWVKSEDRSEFAGIESLNTIELQSYSIP